jgi:hypothetical protein
MTHLKLLGIWTSIFLVSFAPLKSVLASTLSDAQAALNRAYNDYYKTLRSGAAKTPEQQQKLKEEIIGPAERGLYRAMQVDAQENNHSGGSTGDGSTTDSSSVQNSFSMTPETLDGSDIPKEIEFPGKGAKSPRSTSSSLPKSPAAPKPSPSSFPLFSPKPSPSK